MTLEYDGTGFFGWQVQPGKRTVQGVVEEALFRLVREEVALTAASRTDAGVHATGQVANFVTESSIPPERFALALNAVLPIDVSAVASDEVHSGFNARHDCTGRAYRYTVLNRRTRSPLISSRAYFAPYRLELDGMVEAGSMLKGCHDFSSFRSTDDAERNPVRTVRRLEIRRDGDLIFIDVEAGSFLRNMVRIICGTLLEVGRKRFSPAWVLDVLEARTRCAGGPTLPPHGLCLTKVSYGVLELAARQLT